MDSSMAVTFTAATPRAPMLRVSLIVEALRAQPALMVRDRGAGAGRAVDARAVALLFGAAGRACRSCWRSATSGSLGSPYGPPLAFWLGEIAFDVAGRSIIGVYLLSQLCVVATYWAVFVLGRRIVGSAHAAMAILLMAGIGAFTAPTLEFGPSVLAMPLSAVSLLFAYRAIVDNKRRDWLTLGAALGCLLLTSTAGLILFALIAAFLVAAAQGRARLATVAPWAAFVDRRGDQYPADPLAAACGHQSARRARRSAGHDRGRRTAGDMAAASRMARCSAMRDSSCCCSSRAACSPAATRARRRSNGSRSSGSRKAFVYVFALAPAFVATLLAALIGSPTPVGGTAPLVILSGLAIVVAAGDTIRLYRQRTGALVWLGLLLVPPAMIVAATVTLPWIVTDLEVGKPAAAMGEFFTDTFRRRTGRPLTIVIGDVRSAGLVAFTSPDRPSLYVDGAPERAPWVSEDTVRRNGAIVLWAVTDAAGTPPRASQGPLPRPGCGSAALVLAADSGSPAAVAYRLGRAPAELIL